MFVFDYGVIPRWPSLRLNLSRKRLAELFPNRRDRRRLDQVNRGLYVAANVFGAKCSVPTRPSNSGVHKLAALFLFSCYTVRDEG